MTDPQWKAAAGHPGYDVSNTGEVRRCDLFDPHGRQTSKARTIAQNLTGPKKAQYLEVSLTAAMAPGRRMRRKVHHLVLEAFIGPRPDGMVGCHNDGDKQNNHVDNLRWDSQANNIHDMFRHQGGHWNAKKTHCKHGHELTPDNLYVNGSGRKCRTCARDRATAQYLAKRSDKGKHGGTPGPTDV